MIRVPDHHEYGYLMVNMLPERREDLALSSFFLRSGSPPEWLVTDSPILYEAAVEAMETRAAEVAAGHAPELVWLLEHPPLYTSGTSAKAGDLINARFPVFATGRGGQFTYHGPGQRVVYLMLDLKRRRQDVRAYVAHADACVAPMRIARGIQNKVLEAMAMGRPTVVTSDALEGIHALPGTELLLANTPEEFAQACLSAAGLSGESLGTAARARVVKDYAWPALLEQFDQLLNQGKAAPVL